MARRQGPEEKYYPQVWRFLRRCTSPLPTPRGGNTFASRNGLSNRFRHMDQPQSLRHRYEPGSKATMYMNRRSLPAGKNRRSGKTHGMTAESECHSPPGHGGHGTNLPIHRQVWKAGRPMMEGVLTIFRWERFPACVSEPRTSSGEREKR